MRLGTCEFLGKRSIYKTTKAPETIDDEIHVNRNPLRKKINVYCLYVGKQFEMIHCFEWCMVSEKTSRHTEK